MRCSVLKKVLVSFLLVTCTMLGSTQALASCLTQTQEYTDKTEITKDEWNQTLRRYDNNTTVLTVSQGVTKLSPGQIADSDKLLSNAGVEVRPAAAALTVDNVPVKISVYEVGGNTYFKIRDIALALNGSEKSFSVEWEQSRGIITLSRGPYTPVGGELEGLSGTGPVLAAEVVSDVRFGIKTYPLYAYTINGNHYYKLRDLAKYLNFGVTWIAEKNTVAIDTNVGYADSISETAQLELIQPGKTSPDAATYEAANIATFQLKYPDLKISTILTDDFDSDGIYESFIDTKDEDYYSTIWMVHDNSVKVVNSSYSVPLNEFNVLDYGGYKHIMVCVGMGLDVYSVSGNRFFLEFGEGGNTFSVIDHTVFDIKEILSDEITWSAQYQWNPEVNAYKKIA